MHDLPHLFGSEAQLRSCQSFKRWTWRAQKLQSEKWRFKCFNFRGGHKNFHRLAFLSHHTPHHTSPRLSFFDSCRQAQICSNACGRYQARHYKSLIVPGSSAKHGCPFRVCLQRPHLRYMWVKPAVSSSIALIEACCRCRLPLYRHWCRYPPLAVQR